MKRKSKVDGRYVPTGSDPGPVREHHLFHRPLQTGVPVQKPIPASAPKKKRP